MSSNNRGERPPDARLNGVSTVKYGPKMLALDERRRNFVRAMAAHPFGTQAEWAQMAGYSERKISAKLRGHRLVHDPRVEAAVFEYATDLLHTEGPILAVAGILQIARDSNHPRQLRALETLANRTGFHELSEHRVRVEHSEESAAAKAERIRMVAGLLGVDVTQLLGANNVTRETKPEPKLIEGKVETDGDAGEGR